MPVKSPMIPNFKKMPALNALVAFEAVARHGSFTRAAEELCITHGAVSHRIRQVEEHLRTQLFVRSSKRTLLTPKGQVFLQVVRETLNRLQDAAANVRENVRGLLQLSVMPSFASRWLLDHITDFYRRHPGVDVEIQTSSVLA